MPASWQIESYQTLESTQIPVHLAAAEGREEGFVVQAMQQMHGRGRHGNVWNSPIGNLYMSLLLRPNMPLEQAGQLSFVVAVAISEALDDFIDAGRHIKSLKWPNDIYINGLKVSGILLESSLKNNALDYIVVGIGMNIFSKPELAVSLNDVANQPVYINVVRDRILECLSHTYELWQKKGFAPILKAWLKQAHGLGQPMTARLPSQSYKGVFKGVREDGGIILEQDGGIEKIIHAADVHFGD